MGDMADYNIEQSMDMWQAHVSGNCFEDCRYCEEEDFKPEKDDQHQWDSYERDEGGFCPDDW